MFFLVFSSLLFFSGLAMTRNDSSPALANPVLAFVSSLVTAWEDASPRPGPTLPSLVFFSGLAMAQDGASRALGAVIVGARRRCGGSSDPTLAPPDLDCG